MPRRAAALLTGGLLALGAVSPATGAPRAEPVRNREPERWIVTVGEGEHPGQLARQLSAHLGGHVDHVFRHALRGFSFRGSADAARALARNPRVINVVPDRELRAVEILPWGVMRTDAYHPSANDAYEAGFRGAGVSIGILDTGIDLDHPDLDVDVDRGLNCMEGGGQPEDGHGHGTHVAGTAAAQLNGIGVIGVAPEATVVPIKVLDDSGVGTDATVICGVDYLTGLAIDGDPTNDIPIANMSLGEQGAVGTCSDGGLHQAICQSAAAGVTYVVAAGNSSIDASGFVPASYSEVITVSAMVDLDGQPGGAGGCYFFIYCDDSFAFFSDFGSVVDVTAPGVQVHSTWKNGGYQTSDGTSMASPHVAGVAALVKGANPSASPADIRAILVGRGECPDGSGVEAGDEPQDCMGQGNWSGDPDGIAEPLVNALHSASAASTFDFPPAVSFTSPSEGDNVTGSVQVVANATDNIGVSHVLFEANGAPFADDSDGSDGWSAIWETTSLAPGIYNLRISAFDTAGQVARAKATVSVGTNPQGDWVGTYGSAGYVLAAWNGTSPGNDLISLPGGVSSTLEVGGRAVWSSSTTDVRALDAPDESHRRAAIYHGVPIRVRLTFANAYSGTLHLYAVDWDNLNRRQTVSVANGGSTQTIAITTNFSQGAWLHFPVSVSAGGSLTVTVTKTGGPNAVLSGLFLGDAGPPPPPPPPPYQVAPQGDWVGTYGSAGYVLAAWNGTSPGNDLISLPGGVSSTLEVGGRAVWSSSTTDVRALDAPDESHRRAAIYHGVPIRVRLTFANAYSGTLHLYAVDWDNLNRRQTVSVANGGSTQTIAITTNFSQGAWLHFPVSVSAGGSLTVTVTKTGGPNAVLSGLFLD